jgi:hypothetical protein
MWKSALVGAVALAAAGTVLPVTSVRAGEGGYAQTHEASGFMTEGQIRRMKAALRLSAEQERHWPAVASALRGIRLGNRATAVAYNAFGLQRLVSAAMPLFRTLDDDQKRVAMQLVDSLGFGAFVAAL